MNHSSPNAEAILNSKRDPSVCIIGAGMTGILMAIRLREAGITNLIILEKKDRLGGTWRENTYPAVACDVPSHMYTYSFELNPDWTQRYAGGDEIQQYFERVGRKYNVTPSIKFNEAVTSSEYNEGKWTVCTSQGNTYEVDFVVSCTGILHHPAKPNIKGLEDFEGDQFHTAEWNHDVDLAGKRIGIIGTGSTAAQASPELAEVASKLSIFQRTPHWIFPLGNKDFSPKFREKLRANPNRIRRLRSMYEWSLRTLFTGVVRGNKVLGAITKAVCLSYLKFTIKDPVVRKKLTPDYQVGCKRLILNATYYPAIEKSNVELVDNGIEMITPKGVKTVDGVEHELDVMVLSTGFDPVSFMRPMDLRGKNGLRIDEAWAKKIQTYRSLFMPSFPNFFLMLGPNTPIGNYSVIAMSEVQCDYVLKMIEHWRDDRFDEFDVKTEAVKDFAAYIKEGMKNTAWLGGCSSWYLDGDGDPILWPYSWQQWVKEMAEPDLNAFELKSFTTEPKTKDSKQAA